MQKSKTVVQLSPLQIHRRNISEQAIHTFKNHFVAGLALVDNFFNLSVFLYSEASINHNKFLEDFTEKPKIISVHTTIWGI